MKFRHIPRDKIKANPLQPREHFDREKLKELANSIKEADLLQPIVVRKLDGKYEIVAGERRYKAYGILKKKTMPAVIWEAKDDIDALEKSLIENLQREDLTSVERENAVSELWESERYKNHSILARKIGITSASISGLIRAKEDRKKLKAAFNTSTRTVLETEGLPDAERKQVLSQVEKGKLDASKVRDYVSTIKSIPKERPDIKEDLLKGHSTPEEAEAEIRRYEEEVPVAITKDDYEAQADDLIDELTRLNKIVLGFSVKTLDKIDEKKKVALLRSAVATTKRIKKFIDKLLLKTETKLAIDWSDFK